MLSGILQFVLLRWGSSRALRMGPALLVGGAVLLCFFGCMEWLPLPETYCFSKPDYVQFPDFFM